MITSAYNEKILIKVINQQATGISLINSYAEFLNRCKTANLFSMQFAGFEPFFFSDINNCNTASPTLLTELNNWYFEWMMFCQFREDRNNDFIEKKKQTKKSKVPHFKFTMNSTNISLSKTHKHLGITFSDDGAMSKQ